MSWPIDTTLTLLSTQTGLSLKFALTTNSGTAITLVAKDLTGVVEVGNGRYDVYNATAMPDGFAGRVYFYTGTIGSGTALIAANLVGTPISITQFDEAAANLRFDKSIGSRSTFNAANMSVDVSSVLGGDADDFFTQVVNSVINYLAANATVPGSLGKLLADNLNATVSSRASETNATANKNTVVAAITAASSGMAPVQVIIQENDAVIS